MNHYTTTILSITTIYTENTMAPTHPYYLSLVEHLTKLNFYNKNLVRNQLFS